MSLCGDFRYHHCDSDCVCVCVVGTSGEELCRERERERSLNLRVSVRPWFGHQRLLGGGRRHEEEPSRPTRLQTTIWVVKANSTLAITNLGWLAEEWRSVCPKRKCHSLTIETLQKGIFPYIYLYLLPGQNRPKTKDSKSWFLHFQIRFKWHPVACFVVLPRQLRNS